MAKKHDFLHFAAKKYYLTHRNALNINKELMIIYIQNEWIITQQWIPEDCNNVTVPDMSVQLNSTGVTSHDHDYNTALVTLLPGQKLQHERKVSTVLHK